MLINYLEEYLELVSNMNYTAAARRLNITQSALSKHITALEKEFNATFIDRSKQQIELTQQGRLFCEEASKILDAYHAAHRRIHGTNQEVRIAGALRDSAINNILSRAQDSLHEEGNSIRVVSQEYPLGTLMDALKEKKVDLVIDIMDSQADTNLPIDPQIHIAFLTSVPLFAVMLKTHPFAQRSSISIPELANERIMHPTGSMHIQRGSTIIESLFTKHNVALRKRIFYANSWNDFPTINLDNDIFIMPRSLFNKQLFGSQLFDALCAVPLAEEDARFPYGIANRADDTNPAVLHYIQTLIDAAHTIEK